MDFFNTFVNFFLDTKTRVSSKVSTFISIVVILFFVDNTINFSDNLNINNDISILKKLNILIQDSSSDSLTKSYAIGLKIRIINRKTILQRVGNFFSLRSVASGKSTVTRFWFVITSTIGIFILAIGIYFSIFFLHREIGFLKRLLNAGIAFLTISFLGILSLIITSNIPKISKDTWAYNYVINIVIQFVIFIIVYIILSKKKMLPEIATITEEVSDEKK